MPEPIRQLPALTDAECDAVRDAVMALRPAWTARDPQLPFYTLGAASYLDAVGDAPAYARLAAAGNPLLQTHFGWLHARVAGLLSQALGAPVALAGHLALPGFHVFLASRVFEQAIASVHCDLQYRLHDWRGLQADLTQPLSFTLPVALPRHGGGLHTWDLSLAEWSAQAQPPAPTRHAYRRGHLVLHAGHLLHQIAPGRDLQGDDQRITLQGHGVLAGGVWRLYW
jgi:hypothetical protein